MNINFDLLNLSNEIAFNFDYNYNFEYKCELSIEI